MGRRIVILALHQLAVEGVVVDALVLQQSGGIVAVGDELDGILPLSVVGVLVSELHDGVACLRYVVVEAALTFGKTLALVGARRLGGYDDGVHDVAFVIRPAFGGYHLAPVGAVGHVLIDALLYIELLAACLVVLPPVVHGGGGAVVAEQVAPIGHGIRGGGLVAVSVERCDALYLAACR